MSAVSTYIEPFAKYLSCEKKMSVSTCSSYLRDTKAFTSYMEERAFTIEKADDRFFRDYIACLKEAGKSDATVARAIASLKCYCRFLCEKDYIKRNPCGTLRPERSQKKLPCILTREEVQRLLKSPDATEPRGCRDRAMLELIYATGIRVSELVELNRNDLNLQQGILHCPSEKAERMVPIYKNAIDSLNTYVTKVRHTVVGNDPTGPLFINMSGTRLTRQGFWKILKQYACKIGLEKPLTPHTLRHSFAAHLLENGADIHDVQQILGHADIASTQVYLEVIRNKFRDIYDKYHPMAGNHL